jgi:hypothetical protein
MAPPLWKGFTQYMHDGRFNVCFAAIVALGWALICVRPARAVASFSRQTGLACSACHTTVPELTPLGRLFKLNGYTMTNIRVITSKTGPTKAGLNLNSWLPIAAFIQFSNTVTQRPQPGSQNGSFEFPQSASLFLAGAMAQHAGGFVQVTYNAQADHFSWDNTDVRYANRTKLAGVGSNDRPGNGPDAFPYRSLLLCFRRESRFGGGCAGRHIQAYWPTFSAGG